MATKKTTTTKKTPVKKQTTARKSATKKATAKKTSVRSGLLSSSIGLRPEESAFMTFRITRQTLYWLVLGVVVILFTTWLMKLQMDIQSLYDQIDTTTAETSAL